MCPQTRRDISAVSLPSVANLLTRVRRNAGLPPRPLGPVLPRCKPFAPMPAAITRSDQDCRLFEATNAILSRRARPDARGGARASTGWRGAYTIRRTSRPGGLGGGCAGAGGLLAVLGLDLAGRAGSSSPGIIETGELKSLRERPAPDFSLTL